MDKQGWGWRLYISLGDIWGVMALVTLLRIPGDPKNAWLFGYSVQRWGLILFTLGCVALLTWLVWKTWRQPEYIWSRCAAWIRDEKRFDLVVILLAGIVAVGALALYLAFWSRPFLYQAYFVRVAPVVVMVMGIGAQSLVLAGSMAKEQLGQFVRTWWYPLALLIVVVVAGQRLSVLWPEYAKLPLAPDVVEYREIAHGMHHLYDTGVREPVWIWVVKAALFVARDSDSAFRLLGLGLYLATGCFVWLLVEHTFGDRLMALLAAAIFLWNTFLMRVALVGTRDNLFMLAVTAMSYFVFSRHPRLSGNWRVAGLAFSLLLAVGTRMTSIAPLSVLLVYAFVRNRLRLSLLPIALGFAVLVLAPYVYYSYVRFGDPLIASNIHAVWWRNYEFVYKRGIGCEGCPRVDEFIRNGYAGAKVTMSSYIFGMHSPGELFTGAMRGLETIYFSLSSLFKSMLGVDEWGSAFLLLHTIGWLFLLVGSERWVVFVPLLVTNLLYFFIPLDMPHRLYTANAPFMSLFAAQGGVVLGRCVFQSFRRAVRHTV